MNVTPPVEGVALSVPSLPAVPRSSQRSRCEGVGVEGGGIRMTVLCTYPEPPRLSRPLPETPEDEQEYLLPPRKPPKGTSWIGATFILSNCTLGVGLLYFPAAYSNSGDVPTALCIQSGILVLITAGFLMIAYCSDVYGDKNYQDVVHSFCGTSGLIFCNILIVCHNFGACVTLLVILGDHLDKVLLYAVGSDFCMYWYLTRNFTLSICSAIVILPCCFVQRMDAFRNISFLGVLATIYILFLTIYKYLTIPATITAEMEVEPGPKLSIDTLLQVFPAICFSYESHVEAVPVYACLAKRNLWEFSKTTLCVIVICSSIYTTVGVLGYLTFRSRVTSDLLISYSSSDTLVLVGYAIMALKIVSTYPPIMFCVRTVLDGMLSKNKRYKRIKERSRGIMEAIFLFFLSLALALLVPNIGSAIALLGGSAAFFVFIFPGLCFMKAHWNIKDSRTLLWLLWGIFFLVLGTFIAGSTTAQSVFRFMDQELNTREVVCIA